MWLVNLIPERLKWWLWRMLRPTYLVGVFVIVFRFDEVLIIKKKRGVAMGYQIPGGGKDRGLSPKDAALKELKQETGLDLRPYSIRKLPYVSSNEVHCDIHIVYVAQLDYNSSVPVVQDTFEVESADFVPIKDARSKLMPEHAAILETVLEDMFLNKKTCS
ncbi:MAG: NUDIX domain-containing protein [Candidatus Paceibacterota bacterium]